MELAIRRGDGIDVLRAVRVVERRQPLAEAGQLVVGDPIRRPGERLALDVGSELVEQLDLVLGHA